MTLSAVLLIVVLLVLMLLGLPITWALASACISAIVFDPKLSLTLLPQIVSL